MRGVEGSLGRVDTASKSAGLSTGRLSNQFAGLAAKIAGVHPVLGNLSNTLLDFAVGGAVTAGVLLGVAAIAVAYDKITASARKAKEESDKLSASLERALHLKSLGPGGETVDQAANEKAKAAALGVQIAKMEALIVKDALDADVLASNAIIQDKINKLVIERQNALNRLAGAQSVIAEKVNATLAEQPKHIEKSIAKVKELGFTFEQMRASADEFWGPMRRFNEAFALPSIVQDMTPGAVDISDSVKIADKVGKDILTASEQADRNAQMIHDAIWGSAIQLANQVVGALNIGGGGKGSQVGGAIGSTLGFIAGTPGGPVGQMIGSTIGNIAGSFIGGLFDHKKATELNTAAVRQNTAALLLNTPSGYKTAAGRFDATVIKDLKRAIPRYNSRGGAVASI